MLSRKGRVARAFAGGVTAAGLIAIAAPPWAGVAGAATVTISNSCIGFVINADGTTGVAIPPGDPFPLAATASRTGQPRTVGGGAAFDAVADAASIPVPKSVDTKIAGIGVVPVVNAANIILTIEVGGAASIGAPKLSGGNVKGATAKKTGANQVVVTMPGNLSGDGGIPKATAHFKGGSTFTSPKITIPVKAGSVGTTIVTRLVHFASDSEVLLGTASISARADCMPSSNTLGTTAVVEAGAPNAVDDAATTTPGQAVTIDVLANDQPNSDGAAPDPATLALTSKPGHGTAALTADHEVTYTPAAGFAGTDSFTYKVCVAVATATTTTTLQPDAPRRLAAEAGTELKCDPATVTVTVAAVEEQAPSTTTPTTVSALPRTGSSSTPLALAGVGLCVLGLAAIGTARRAGRTGASSR
ncbi:MAG TPA: Ig-like domain-containing protein [Acidimicrobiia bacterium]|nr:Ig-like domain-containing protein [Acidimicrobiia bacterium]